ncbi:unnamed protein product [Cylicocyclus nassatus]|uniref:Uncharacterized protein n=1 Tax=Cylicocyclus nassatus TaxID=53992 RepID=A0AA36MEI9_CYLNA|nr:unnamed protein product [Cylicocyclus nassatus]
MCSVAVLCPIREPSSCRSLPSEVKITRTRRHRECLKNVYNKAWDPCGYLRLETPTEKSFSSFEANSKVRSPRARHCGTSERIEHLLNSCEFKARTYV